MKALTFIQIFCLIHFIHWPTADAEIHYAKNFEIVDYGSYRILSVSNASRNSTRVYHYALVPKANKMPKLPEDVTLIRTPVERVVAMETVYIGYLEAIKKLDTIVAAATVDFISHPDVRRRVAAETIQEVQIGQALDIEKMLLIQPELIFTSISGDPTFDLPPMLERTGLPIVLTAGYMEQHPLARAEWIRFTAAFFEEDELASRLFDAIKARYEELTHLTESIKIKPTVLCGAPYSGVWHVPGGQSFTAQMIRDAGGDYLWSMDQIPGSIPLDTEVVLLKAASADYWINPSFYRSMNALYNADSRFGLFQPARENRVYNNTRQVSPNGGNAIWEQGIIRPDDVLADLIHIFHPHLLPDHEFVYYQHLK